jgi:hypothetical protein
MATVPGANLFHEGQLEGRKIRLPVFLRRRTAEAVNQPVKDFYSKLLQVVNAPVLREGSWSLCQCTGWPDNSSYQNLLAWSWINETDGYLIVINFSDTPTQRRVQVVGNEIRGKTWRLLDQFSGETYQRDGNEMLIRDCTSIDSLGLPLFSV